MDEAATSFFIQFFVKGRIPGALGIIHFMEPQLFEHKESKNIYFTYFSQTLLMNSKSIRMQVLGQHFNLR